MGLRTDDAPALDIELEDQGRSHGRKDQSGLHARRSGAKDQGSARTIGTVTVRRDELPAALPLLALGLSFVAWLVPITLAWDVMVNRRYFSVYVLGAMAVGILFGEFFVKPLVDQARPETTAVRYPDGSVKAGFPSSHVVWVQVLLICLFVEEVMDQNPAFLIFPGCQIVTAALMLVMPWARWYNGDHTPQQVLASVWLGTVVGMCGWAVQKWYWSDGKTVAVF